MICDAEKSFDTHRECFNNAYHWEAIEDEKFLIPRSGRLLRVASQHIWTPGAWDKGFFSMGGIRDIL